MPNNTRPLAVAAVQNFLLDAYHLTSLIFQNGFQSSDTWVIEVPVEDRESIQIEYDQDGGVFYVHHRSWDATGGLSMDEPVLTEEAAESTNSPREAAEVAAGHYNYLQDKTQRLFEMLDQWSGENHEQ